MQEGGGDLQIQRWIPTFQIATPEKIPSEQQSYFTPGWSFDGFFPLIEIFIKTHLQLRTLLGHFYCGHF